MYFLRDHKDRKLPEANLEIRVDRRKLGEIKIKPDTFSRMVNLEMSQDDIKFSDNYFNLMPNELKIVAVQHAGQKELNWESLRF